MAITSGTYYFGPTESLTDWTDIAIQVNSQTFNGDVVFIQTGNIVQTSGISFSSVNKNNYLLKFTSSLQHLGNPNNAYKTTVSGSGYIRFASSNSDGSNGSGMEFDNMFFSGVGTEIMLTFGYGGRVVMKNTLLERTNTTGQRNSIWMSNAGNKFEGLNLKLWSLVDQNSIITNGSSVACIFENITHYAAAGPFINCTGLMTSAGIIRNCVSIHSASTPVPLYVPNGLSVDHNSSSDGSATGTGSITGVSADGNFESILSADSNFLNLLNTSILISAGSTPSLSANTYGIRGNFRPSTNGFYSIGADQYGNSTMSFVVDKNKGTIPYYFRLTDLSDVSGYTSATDYQRLWSITNLRTSAIEYFESTSASINYCISAGSNLNDAYTISLSAII